MGKRESGGGWGVGGTREKKTAFCRYHKNWKNRENRENEKIEREREREKKIIKEDEKAYFILKNRVP